MKSKVKNLKVKGSKNTRNRQQTGGAKTKTKKYKECKKQNKVEAKEAVRKGKRTKGRKPKHDT